MKAVPILLAVLMGVSACVPRNDTPTAKPADMHTSRNSLDWPGVYNGVLPCADCPGIETSLTLRRDGSYELTTRYQQRPPAPVTVRGQFTWQPGDSAIALDPAGGGQKFAVGEGSLLLLERDGTRPGPSAPNRVLTLVPKPASAAVPIATTLENHRWNLDAATDGQGRPIEALSLGAGRSFAFGFSGARVSVEGGCNRLNGGYRVSDDGKLMVGQMAATMMACEPAAMKADAALSELLAQPLTLALQGGVRPTLRLTAPTNETLTLTGTATPESLYGPPELIFLEVAAQTVACNHPLMPNKACLQVRERRFDTQGLPAGAPGEWQAFYGNIEGYTHRPGERNVLRVKRFTRKPVPADGSKFVYVLDLTIESETMPK